MHRTPVLRIAAVQLLLASLTAAALQVRGDRVTALSVLLGGLLCALPNAYFGLLAFRHRGARAASQVVQSFYRGETGKFVLTLLGFAAVFAAVRPLNAAALFISYSLCIVLQWLLAARWIR